MFGCCCEVLLNKTLIRSFFFITLQFIQQNFFFFTNFLMDKIIWLDKFDVSSADPQTGKL